MPLNNETGQLPQNKETAWLSYVFSKEKGSHTIAATNKMPAEREKIE